MEFGFETSKDYFFFRHGCTGESAEYIDMDQFKKVRSRSARLAPTRLPPFFESPFSFFMRNGAARFNIGEARLHALEKIRLVK
jgi:hypothetical protein